MEQVATQVTLAQDMVFATIVIIASALRNTLVLHVICMHVIAFHQLTTLFVVAMELVYLLTTVFVHQVTMANSVKCHSALKNSTTILMSAQDMEVAMDWTLALVVLGTAVLTALNIHAITSIQLIQLFAVDMEIVRLQIIVNAKMDIVDLIVTSLVAMV